MECRNCELHQRQFYCENCLKQHLLSIRLQTNHATTDRDAHIASAQRSLESTINPARERRAELKGREERVREVWQAVDDTRKVNDNMRERLRSVRALLACRRRTLAVASSTFHPATPHTSSRSPASTSVSPPNPSPPALPGSFPLAPASLPTSPQTPRPAVRRGSSSYSIQSHSPSPNPTPPAAIPRQPVPPSRTGHPYSSPSASPSSRTPFSTSPQAGRLLATSPSSTSPLTHYSPSRPAVGATQHSDRGVDTLARQIDEASYQLAGLSDTIARARSGLVQELVEVFSVVEVGGRPPIGGKAGTKGEWTIGGLVLPVPGDIRRYPPDHINAVITHTIHFMSLLSFYLGIKLPFEVTWSRSASGSSVPSSGASGDPRANGLLGVGVPWISAIKGGESGGWARWSAKHPLHVSSASEPATSASSRATHVRSTSQDTPGHGRSSLMSASLADSHMEEESPSTTSSQGSSFTTALAMLLYNVCYLAHTQAVEVPLAQAGEVLGNLWAVCCSPELGRRSHATHPLLSAPTPPTFSLDFAQLLQATTANPNRPRARGTTGKGRPHTERIVEEDEEGWDIVDANATE